MRRGVKVGLMVGVPLLGLLAWWLWWFGGEFHAGYVCGVCGCERMEESRLWVSRSELRETSLSRFYERGKAGGGHEHQWLFASGSGGAVSCALGSGSTLYMVNDPDEPLVGLERLRAEGGEAKVDEWMARLLDPELSTGAARALSRLEDESLSFDEAYEEVEKWYAKSAKEQGKRGR